MTLNQVIAYAQGAYGFEITPPVMYSVGIFMLANSGLVTLKSSMQLAGTRRGFKPRSLRTILIGFLLALWLFQRGMQVFQEKSIKANALMLSVIFFGYWISDIFDYVRQSRLDNDVRESGYVRAQPGIKDARYEFH